MLLIRLLTLIVALPLRIWVLAQRVTGKITPQTAQNRLGRATTPKPDAPVIWIHAASLGELSSVRPFLSHLCETQPNHRLLITTNNPAALGVAAQWPKIPAILQTAPLDIPAVLRNFLHHWQPVAFVNVETEVWPNRFAALAARNIPCIALNARMSAKSAKRFTKIGQSIGLHHFKAIYAQNASSAENFRKVLGPKAMIDGIPNFKSMVKLPNTDPVLVSRFDHKNTVLAASTHEGEDVIILSAFSKLAAKDKALKLIIAPRHPDRCADIFKIAQDMGFTPKPLNDPSETNIYIVEQLGQLPQLYALSAATFVGGSLVPGIGGHTPYEPIRAESAIITGEFTNNFFSEYAALNDATACQITDPETLRQAFAKALENPSQYANNARAILPPVENSDALFAKIIRSMGLT
ncbi:MAG: glycosyltransferase N-terminal domain-containing protein [Amylibacter sp.]